MNRREFLAASGLGAAIVAIPGVGFISTSMKEAAMGIINQEFDYLTLDQQGVEMFVEDYIKHHHNRSLSSKLKGSYLLKLRSSDSGFVSGMAEKYIKSTDFFAHKMDENRIIMYVGEYHPYLSPCANPFTDQNYPPEEALG